MFGRMGRDFGRLGGGRGGAIGWIPNPANSPDIAINWTTNQAWLKTTGLTTPAALGVSTSRASVKQVVDGNGNWSQVAANVTAQSNLGRSTEEARTNSIRNNTMQGAVAGTPGTLPTNWILSGNSVANGLSSQVVGTGTQNGVDYIDFRIFGTTTATGTFFTLFSEATTNIAALYGQTWTASNFVALVGGSLTNVSSTNVATVTGRSNVGGSIEAGVNNANPTPTLTRYSVNYTLANASSVFVTNGVGLNFSGSGSAVDITLRIGWPQLENNSINSTVASATVAAGGASGVTGTAVYSVGGGTGTAATLNVTVSGGAITAINSVASAGSYSVFPPSPAALTYVSGTGSGVVGATVNLTPTNLAANAFATSPIKTTAGAATRAADVTSLAGQTFGSAATIFSQATPQAPSPYSTAQIPLALSDGSNSNRIQLVRNAAGASLAGGLTESGGVVGYNISNGPALVQNTQFKGAIAATAGAQQADFNGTALTAGVAAAFPIGLSQINFGAVSSSAYFDGLAAIDAIWLTQAVPQVQLQSMTAP